MINKKGQNIAEYTIIIGLVGAALLAMSVYFQRGIQLVIKEPADHLGGFDSGIFSPQRIQEMGIEDKVDIDYGPAVPKESTTIVNNTNTATSYIGGGRRLDLNENINVPSNTERGYTRIEYDQVSR